MFNVDHSKLIIPHVFNVVAVFKKDDDDSTLSL